MRVAAATAMARGAKDGGESARTARGISRGVERLEGGATHPFERDLITAAARRHARRNGREIRGNTGSDFHEEKMMLSEENEELGKAEGSTTVKTERTWEDRADAFRRRAQQALRDASGPWKARWTYEDEDIALAQLDSGDGAFGHQYHDET